MARKTNKWIFQATKKWNLAQKGLDMAAKGKTESLLRAPQNNAIRSKIEIT